MRSKSCEFRHLTPSEENGERGVQYFVKENNQTHAVVRGIVVSEGKEGFKVELHVDIEK